MLLTQYEAKNTAKNAVQNKTPPREATNFHTGANHLAKRIFAQMANINILYSEPRELTISEFREMTKWPMPKLARELGQTERRLWEIVKKDHQDTPHYRMIRQHIALVFKLSFPDFADIYEAFIIKR
ncbi:MAG: hypothetical protein ACRCT1_22905 [Microcoleaceae cyanobacterium]